MKYLRVGLPFFVVLACILNSITAYGSDNMPAVYANVTALFGWIAIAHDEYLTYCRNKRNENVSDSVA
jgi:hypothetical protein